MRKYKFTGETKTLSDGTILNRIVCVKDFQHAKKGDLGGWIEKYENLQVDAWVRGGAMVIGNALVKDNVIVIGPAIVSGHAVVSGNARVIGNARINLDNDYCVIQNFGSKNRTTTFYRTEKGVSVTCGCFQGTLKEFKKQFKKTHNDNKYAKEYLAMIKLVKIKFEL